MSNAKKQWSYKVEVVYGDTFGDAYKNLEFILNEHSKRGRELVCAMPGDEGRLFTVVLKSELVPV